MQTPPAAPSSASPSKAARARFRLVDDFQAGYIKFQGREPRTLEELAIAKADYQHRRRLAEIKALAKKLALLDAHLPALAERGIKLGHREINTWDGGKTLRFTSFGGDCDKKLFDALIALGFKEVERKDSISDEQTVTLKHGRALLVSVDVKKPAAASAAPATAGSAA
jgi:hypothetical protein